MIKTLNIWIEEGYKQFGLYGPDNISIKKIAEDASISRTTFNYYFKDKDEFINELILHHVDMHSQFCKAGKQHCKKYLPDLHKLILTFPSGFKFHKQLFNHMNISKYRMAYFNCNEMSSRVFVVQLFIDYYSLPLKFEDALLLHESLTETWYSRLDIEDMRLETLIDLTEEIMKPLLQLIKNIQTKTREEIITYPLELL